MVVFLASLLLYLGAKYTVLSSNTRLSAKGRGLSLEYLHIRPEYVVKKACSRKLYSVSCKISTYRLHIPSVNIIIAMFSMKNRKLLKK